MNLENFKIKFKYKDQYAWRKFLTVLELDGRIKWQSCCSPLEFDPEQGWVWNEGAGKETIWFFIEGFSMTFGCVSEYKSWYLATYEEVLEECDLENREDLILKTMVLNG